MSVIARHGLIWAAALLALLAPVLTAPGHPPGAASAGASLPAAPPAGQPRQAAARPHSPSAAIEAQPVGLGRGRAARAPRGVAVPARAEDPPPGAAASWVGGRPLPEARVPETATPSGAPVLVITRAADGSDMVELDERHMHHTVLRIGVDGRPRVDCVPGLERALSLARRRLDSLRVSRGEAR